MNAPLRRTGVVVLVLFAMLFVNLNWVQGYRADEYRTSRYNGRVQVAEYNHPRGKIALANTVVADSAETSDTLKYMRTYPFGPLYAHVVGYRPVNLETTDIERLENDFLTGNATIQAGDRLTAIFTGKRAPGGIVQLTISQAAQETAYKQLVENTRKVPKGAVVALDPATGALLASVSTPSFDPNPLVVHNTEKATAAYRALEANPDKPLADRALSEIKPPGSTFKVITAAAAMADNALTADSVIPGGSSYQPPESGSFTMKNAPGVNCPDQLTLKEALRISCNTAFARLGVEVIKADRLKATAKAFGFEEAPLFTDDNKNAMGTATSRTGTMSEGGRVEPAFVAQSSIGQKDVEMSPLQGALVAATVANGGRQMRPFMVERLQSADLSTVKETIPKEQRRPLDSGVATALQDMMVAVVESGTGKNARVKGLRVGGKTGTAENAEDAKDHGWFIGWAMRDGKPLVAVAVYLENAGKGGSAEASRIGGAVMKAYADENGRK
ncbi:MAG TPA: penicillin-binding transpeptidase domain-containing protein [Micromonosporaceae bacterium]|nr:penicillin-binding transpeptidase domain-containing protein [Micromonosporaceae bacterium]